MFNNDARYSRIVLSKSRFVISQMPCLLYLTVLAAGLLCIEHSDTVASASTEPYLKSHRHRPHQRMKGGEIPATEEEKKKHPKYKGPSRGKTRRAVDSPKCFDAREQWPKCESIRHIRQQAGCNTCYAVVPASVISDRLCIASGQTDQTLVSAVHLVGCYSERSDKDNCDLPGCTPCTYENAALKGYITGGDYMKPVGCAPYPRDPVTLSCPAICPKTGYSPPVAAADIRLDDSYWTRYLTNPNDQDEITQAVKEMQSEIMANGPISASIKLYDDLEDWTPEQGAYRPSASATEEGNHAVRIIGWCEDSNGVPYWTIANSWGTELGDLGIYWIERGRNVANVENAFHGPIIRIAQTCAKSFCSAGFDQLVRLDSGNMSSPVYAFQGNCTVQVNVDSTGRLTPIGEPVPIAAVFLNAPSGPIVGWDATKDRVLLQNSTASGSCSLANSSSKYSCTFYNKHGGVRIQTFLNGINYQYEPKYPDSWWIDNSAASIQTAITSKYTQVNTLLGLRNGKILICGIRVAGGQACGTIDTTGKILSEPVPVSSSFTQCGDQRIAIERI